MPVSSSYRQNEKRRLEAGVSVYPWEDFYQAAADFAVGTSEIVFRTWEAIW